MKFVLLFVETEQFERDLEAMSQSERDRAYQLAGKWMADHADKIRWRQQAETRIYRHDRAAERQSRACHHRRPVCRRQGGGQWLHRD